MSTEGYGSQPKPEPTDAPGAHDLLIADLRTRIERNEAFRERLPGMEMRIRAQEWEESLRRRIENDQMLIAELEARKQLGLDKYGTLLQHDSDRDPTQDLVEELGDAMAYTKSWQQERKMLLAKIDAVTAVLSDFRGQPADKGVELHRAVSQAIDATEPARSIREQVDRILGTVRTVTPEASALIDEIDAVVNPDPLPLPSDAAARGRTRTELHEIVVRRSNAHRALADALEEDPSAFARADDYGKLVRQLRAILDGAK